MPARAELVGPFPPGVDPQGYDQLRRRVLWSLPNGLYLLASRAGERRNLMAISLVTQLATDPKLLGVVVERDALTCELVRAGGCFALVLLGREQRSLVRRFVKAAEHDPLARTLAGHGYCDAPVTGVPIPEFAPAYLDCRLTNALELGSHCLCIGEVVDVGLSEESALELPLRMEDTRMSYGG